MFQKQIYRHEIDVPLEKISEFKKLVFLLQLDVYYYVESEDESDDVVDESNSEIVPENISMDVDLVERNASDSVAYISSFDHTLSPLESSRRWRNHREYRPRKSLAIYNGPWSCAFCPSSPFFNSKIEKTQHEMYCSFNLNSDDFFICDSCGKKFVLKKSIDNHVHKHI